LAPLADYLAKQLDVKEIDRGRVAVAENVFEMARMFEEGEVDLYVGDPLPAVAVTRLARISLALECSGRETQALVFAVKNGGVVGLEDLVGKVIAFDSPVSTFGYLLPKLVLASKGASLRRCDSASEAVVGERVGYVFSGDDENTIAWVLRGKVAAGAMRSDLFARRADGLSDRLGVVYRSVSLPAEVVALRATLPSTVASRLVTLITEMDGDEDGRKVLEGLTDGAACEPLTQKTLSALENVQPFLRAEFGLP
jgi:phosphonate transport system substrate-binding protein